MKIYSKDLLHFNLHLGKWKKLNTVDSNCYFINRYVFKIEETINSLLKITIFLNFVLKSKGKILFLGSNTYTLELIENLAISSQQFFLKPWGFGLFTNTKLYRRYTKALNHAWGFNPATVVFVDPTGIDMYFKEVHGFKIPTVSFYNGKSTYSINSSFVSFNSVNFFVKFLRSFLKNKKYFLNYYETGFKKKRLLKKKKLKLKLKLKRKRKSRQVVFLNKTRLIRVKNIRKKWFKPSWNIKAMLKKNAKTRNWKTKKKTFNRK